MARRIDGPFFCLGLSALVSAPMEQATWRVDSLQDESLTAMMASRRAVLFIGMGLMMHVITA